jgi:hypothetical protein
MVLAVMTLTQHVRLPFIMFRLLLLLENLLLLLLLPLLLEICLALLLLLLLLLSHLVVLPFPHLLPLLQLRLCEDTLLPAPLLLSAILPPTLLRLLVLFFTGVTEPDIFVIAGAASK